MRDRVAQHVHEHLGEALEDDAVELGLGPDDRELDLLACGERHVAHGAWERPGDRRERQRAHADRSVLQLVQQAIADVELVGDALVQARLRIKRVLQAAAMGDRLAHQVEQPVELVGGDADRPTWLLQHILDGVGQLRDVVETENPGRPLQRVRVAEQQVDRLAAVGDTALTGEQHRHHRVEQLVRLVAEDRQELGLVLKHRRSPARPAHHAR